ncbi:hypothetical protein EG332_17985 [Pectobacterium versatile]|nr:hypothetical protein EG332_17985 [Pectobacterium versatile]
MACTLLYESVDGITFHLSGSLDVYTRHTSSCLCVGCAHSPESLTCVSSSGFPHLPPSCNSNYLGSIPFSCIKQGGYIDKERSSWNNTHQAQKGSLSAR